VTSGQLLRLHPGAYETADGRFQIWRGWATKSRSEWRLYELVGADSWRERTDVGPTETLFAMRNRLAGLLAEA
jgi:hypothetical protein